MQRYAYVWGISEGRHLKTYTTKHEEITRKKIHEGRKYKDKIDT